MSNVNSNIAPPAIFAASLGRNGAVNCGISLTETQAVSFRQLGLDVVICGTNLAANRQLARKIESSANGHIKLCPPHKNAGRFALPHCQPDPRPPAGHTFYETPKRQAF